MIFRCKLNNNKRQKSRTSDSHLSIYLEEFKGFKGTFSENFSLVV